MNSIKLGKINLNVLCEESIFNICPFCIIEVHRQFIRNSQTWDKISNNILKYKEY
jgi:hypothetical protein